MKLEFIKPERKKQDGKAIVRINKKGLMTLNVSVGGKIQADTYTNAAIARDPDHPDGSRLYLATFREPNDFSVLNPILNDILPNRPLLE